ncbi:MAG: hypothetical protein U7127_12005 [Phormidium sp.]
MYAIQIKAKLNNKETSLMLNIAGFRRFVYNFGLYQSIVVGFHPLAFKRGDETRPKGIYPFVSFSSFSTYSLIASLIKSLIERSVTAELVRKIFTVGRYQSKRIDAINETAKFPIPL